MCIKVLQDHWGCGHIKIKRWVINGVKKSQMGSFVFILVTASPQVSLTTGSSTVYCDSASRCVYVWFSDKKWVTQNLTKKKLSKLPTFLCRLQMPHLKEEIKTKTMTIPNKVVSFIKSKKLWTEVYCKLWTTHPFTGMFTKTSYRVLEITGQFTHLRKL